MIRNILWDVDGTLFDTYPAITYAISKSLNKMGLSIALNVIDGVHWHDSTSLNWALGVAFSGWMAPGARAWQILAGSIIRICLVKTVRAQSASRRSTGATPGKDIAW